MKEIRRLSILNLLFYIVAFLISSLSQFKMFSDLDMGEVSHKYDSVFTPAPFTFAIWGVIYLSLFGFTIYHLVQVNKSDMLTEANETVLKIGHLFIINNIVISLWVFVFLNQWLLSSVILILIQLITLIVISLRINLFDIHKSLANKVFTQFSLSIYFAWISVASIANISVYLVSIKWDGFGVSENNWAIVMVTIAFLLAIFMVKVKRNPFFGLVVLWAIIGIKFKNENSTNTDAFLLIKLCYFYIGALTILILLQFYHNYKLRIAVT